jgi:hypothetical protein
MVHSLLRSAKRNLDFISCNSQPACASGLHQELHHAARMKAGGIIISSMDSGGVIWISDDQAILSESSDHPMVIQIERNVSWKGYWVHLDTLHVRERGTRGSLNPLG